MQTDLGKQYLLVREVDSPLQGTEVRADDTSRDPEGDLRTLLSALELDDAAVLWALRNDEVEVDPSPGEASGLAQGPNRKVGQQHPESQRTARQPQRKRTPGPNTEKRDKEPIERRDLRIAGIYVAAAAFAAATAAVVTTKLGASNLWATTISVAAAASVVIAYVLRDPDRRLRVIAQVSPVLALLGLIAGALGFFGLGGDDEPEPVNHIKPGGETVSIYNKVTSGPRLMREDRPLRLFFSPALCRNPDCVLPGTNFRTGNKLNGVVCQTVGDRITNGDDTSTADDKNPNLAESRLWYGVRTDRERLAYFSAIWVDPDQRDGLGLPDCSSINPK